MNHKPDRYTTVAPYLIVDGADQTLDFLKTVFGAVELRRIVGDGGIVKHAEVRIDDSILMIADKAPDWRPVYAHVHVYVPDVDEVYKTALDRGAESIQKPMKQEDPDRRAGVKDSGGTTWWIATKID